MLKHSLIAVRCADSLPLGAEDSADDKRAAGDAGGAVDCDVLDRSTFSKNRHGRFRESDLLRKLFETVVARCMKDGLVGAKPLPSTRA
jgi:transposase